jgi:hypothetical protein
MPLLSLRAYSMSGMYVLMHKEYFSISSDFDLTNFNIKRAIYCYIAQLSTVYYRIVNRKIDHYR